MQSVSRSNKIFSPAATGVITGSNQNAGPEKSIREMFADARTPLPAMNAEFLQAALSAAQRGINRHSLADVEVFHLLTDGLHLTEKFMPRDNWQTEIGCEGRH